MSTTRHNGHSIHRKSRRSMLRQPSLAINHCARSWHHRDEKGRTFIWWTDSYHFTTDESVSSSISPVGLENPISMMPAVTIDKTRTGTTGRWRPGLGRRCDSRQHHGNRHERDHVHARLGTTRHLRPQHFHRVPRRTPHGTCARDAGRANGSKRFVDFKQPAH